MRDLRTAVALSPITTETVKMFSRRWAVILGGAGLVYAIWPLLVALTNPAGGPIWWPTTLGLSLAVIVGAVGTLGARAWGERVLVVSLWLVVVAAGGITAVTVVVFVKEPALVTTRLAQISLLVLAYHLVPTLIGSVALADFYRKARQRREDAGAAQPVGEFRVWLIHLRGWSGATDRRRSRDLGDRCVQYGDGDDGWVDYVRGANIGGFVKVAEAMMAYGVV